MASLEKSETLATLDPWSIGSDLWVTEGQSYWKSVPALSSCCLAHPLLPLSALFPWFCAQLSFQSDLL